MSTLLNLVNEVLRKSGQRQVATLVDPETPAAQSIDFVNQIYFEMLQVLKVKRLVKTASLNTVSGTVNYTLASDVDIDAILPDSVMETQEQQILDWVNYTYPLTHDVNATGKPDKYYIQGNSLYFYPVPDSVYSIQYQYRVKASQLSGDSAVTELPEEWERILVQGALSLLEKFLGEPDYRESYQLYREGILQLRSRSLLKNDFRMKGYYRGN